MSHCESMKFILDYIARHTFTLFNGLLTGCDHLLDFTNNLCGDTLSCVTDMAKLLSLIHSNKTRNEHVKCLCKLRLYWKHLINLVVYTTVFDTLLIMSQE